MGVFVVFELAVIFVLVWAIANLGAYLLHISNGSASDECSSFFALSKSWLKEKERKEQEERMNLAAKAFDKDSRKPKA